MGRLYYASGRGEVVNRTIVDILTTNQARTSVSTCKKGRFIPDIIGINSVSQGKPKRLGNEWYERGLVNPEVGDTLYLIDAERKILGTTPNVMDLFYDIDKVIDKNKFMWDGTLQEILRQFQSMGYRIENI